MSNHNNGLSVRNSSGFRGVSKLKRDGSWRVNFCDKGNKIFLGYFKNTEIYNQYHIEEKLPIGKYFLDFAIIDLKLNIYFVISLIYQN